MVDENPIKIDAKPTKELFIYMLIKDIDLLRSILDLADNCFDGAQREKIDNFSNKWIDITLNDSRFIIKDNCGGIPINIAQHYAFRFGSPKEFVRTNNSIGQFGVGMKRTLFKLGNKFTIESKTNDDHFQVTVIVSEWVNLDSWEFELVKIDSGSDCLLSEPGTAIVVDELHENIKEKFRLENFKNALKEELQSANIMHLEKGISFTFNNTPLVIKPIELLQSDNIKTAYKKTEVNIILNGESEKVIVEIYAGISKDISEDKFKTGSPNKAGWYVFCNNRLVLEADKSNLTGWGGKNRQFTNNYAHFRGYVFFNSKQSSLLPWNTTKTGVDPDSNLYMSIKLKMVTLMYSVTNFLNEFHKEKRDDSLEDKCLFEELKKAEKVNFHDIEPCESFKIPDFKIAGSRPKNITTTISYQMEKEKINKVKKLLKVSTNKDVGIKTFEYFMEYECED